MGLICRIHGCLRYANTCARQFTKRGSGVRAVMIYREGEVHLKQNSRNRGSLGGEMRMRVKEHCRDKSNHTKSNYLHAGKSFDSWRKEAGLSNKYVREHPREAVVQWVAYLDQSGMAQSTQHTMCAGCCCGLGIPSNGIVKHGNAMQKSKSLGNSERARSAREKTVNRDIVHFQEMVGGRRNALARLTGKDFGYDRFGNAFVIFRKDKGSKDQHQLLIDSDVAAVKAYFDQVGPDELLFPKLDRDLDLHGIRAERARRAYLHYAEVASTPAGREQLRQQLWARYTDPEIGCKAWLLAKANGDKAKMLKLEYRFKRQMEDGTYYLRGANRQAAIERGRPVAYDRLAVLATSVFSLSHWRLDVAAKSYLI